MRVLVTGANGYVGAALVRRLLREGIDGTGDVSELVIVDQKFDAGYDDTRIVAVSGDFSAAPVLDVSLARPIDIAFHLASTPGAQAAADPGLGDRVNLHGTVTLFERLGQHRAHHERVPRVVFASSVAVYGASLSKPLDEHTPARPETSYGAHKLIGEVLLGDWTRRGSLDGRSLRLPGIVARPGMSMGHGSAFMSAIFRAAQLGQPYTCPVSPSATAWWMSRACCVDNLLHAARLPSEGLHAERVWAPPMLRLEVAAMVDALIHRFGSAQIDYAPDESIERLFGNQPPLIDHRAIAAGFQHDGTIDALIARALADD